MTYDKIILGAGLYGLYSAVFCARQGDSVLVLEKDDGAFTRATHINQARVHNGYHYPRSYSTAIKSAHYFRRFCADFGFCNKTDFDQVYATSAAFSWTNAEDFVRFCRAAGIRCDRVEPARYFQPGLCDGAFLTHEYTYDAALLRSHFLHQLEQLPGVTVQYNAQVQAIEQQGSLYAVHTADGGVHRTPFLLNATYAGVNTILKLLDFEPFAIKYELCEIILCRVCDELKNTGLTVMDGPFFSLMPFGKTGYHSLTSVTFTPHDTSYDALPTFDCQRRSGGYCRPEALGNCDRCPARPKSAWPYMSQLARKYMQPGLTFEYVSSLYSMKPILKASEVDDSRPTVVRVFHENPTFVSVLSGKINTVYDLDEVLRRPGASAPAAARQESPAQKGQQA